LPRLGNLGSVGGVPGDERPSRFGAARRLAFFPARVAARASRDQFETAADEHLVPEVLRVADRAFAGSLPEDLARSIAEHHVLERMAAELTRSGALDNAVEKALASPQAKELMKSVVESDAVRGAIKDVAASPEVRAALTEQSIGLVAGLVAEVRERTVELDGRIGARRARSSGRAGFAGLATRGAAFALDVLVIAVVFAVVAGLLGLVSYLVGGLRPKWLVGTLVGGGWLLIAAAYLVFFWSSAGRTPGMYLMKLRVRTRAGRPPSVVRALVRAVVTWLSIVPFFLGYVTALFDDRRRGVPDLVAGTEVVYDDG
jgi:uncharacterized RDD family membrane protein YckC